MGEREREEGGEKKNVHWQQTEPPSKTCRRAFLDVGRCRICCSKSARAYPASLGEPFFFAFLSS